MSLPEGRLDNWLHVLHRQKAGRDIFLGGEPGPRIRGAQQFTFRVTARGEPECWDPMRNEITTPRFRRIDAGTVEVSLTLEPLETVLLVFQPEKIAPAAADRAGHEADAASRSRWCAIPIRRHAAAAGPQAAAVDPQPVKAADPFRGRATIPADVDLARCRVCLEMDDLPGEAAAVTVNGQPAGGLIGRPLRLDITRYLKPGENTILIEPLAPKAARLAFYPGT